MSAQAAGRSGAVLYTPAILALAVELADHPLAVEHALRGSAHSRLCGSKVEIGLTTGPDGAVSAAGARVTACAIGQAAAALFLRSVARSHRADIARAHGELQAWLTAEGPQPNWPGLAHIAPARAYPARHAAILLPWKAALAALSNPARAD